MRLSGGIAALLLAFATGAVAADKYAGPDDPATQAAARAALGGAKVLDLGSPKILDIVGATRGIESVLKDLNAKVTDREIRIELAADVLFDFDKHDLRPEAVPSLQKVAEVLRSRAGSPVTIEGHSDGKGTDAYNQPLSEKRAQAVREWLVKKGGASAAGITTKGWGKSKPIVPNTRPDGSDDPDGRKKNRRVEITVRTS
jgi:outer membrane protein OmpA-like peptidoglycan-associated protein